MACPTPRIRTSLSSTTCSAVPAVTVKLTVSFVEAVADLRLSCADALQLTSSIETMIREQRPIARFLIAKTDLSHLSSPCTLQYKVTEIYRLRGGGIELISENLWRKIGLR
jgi:hypothetical protein